MATDWPRRSGRETRETIIYRLSPPSWGLDGDRLALAKWERDERADDHRLSRLSPPSWGLDGDWSRSLEPCG